MSGIENGRRNALNAIRSAAVRNGAMVELLPAEAMDQETVKTALRDSLADRAALAVAVRQLDERVEELANALAAFMLRVLPAIPGAAEQLTEHFMANGASPEQLQLLAEKLTEAEAEHARGLKIGEE